jgi:hypothetical protein
MKALGLVLAHRRGPPPYTCVPERDDAVTVPHVKHLPPHKRDFRPRRESVACGFGVTLRSHPGSGFRQRRSLAGAAGQACSDGSDSQRSPAHLRPASSTCGIRRGPRTTRGPATHRTAIAVVAAAAIAKRLCAPKASTARPETAAARAEPTALAEFSYVADVAPRPGSH